MQQEKIRLANNLRNKINEIRVNIKRTEEALHNLVRSNLEKSFIENSKLKNKEKLEKYQEDIIKFEDEISQIERGEKDQEIEERIEKNKKDNLIISEKNKAENIKNKAEFDIKQKQSYENIRKHTYEMYNDGGEKYKEKEWDRALNHYYKAIEKVPDYILKNLKEMPNNKGYRFMNVDFYGRLAAEPGEPTILFEKQKDNILIIHEFLKDRTKVTKKYPNGKKEVLQDNFTPSLINKQANFTLKQTKKKTN